MVEISQDTSLDEYLFHSTLVDKSMQEHLFEGIIWLRAFDPCVHFLF